MYLTSLASTRRTMLRGMFKGAALSVGIPYLDIFLNTNGTALASGAPLPVRFGTWHWGLGMTPAHWVPTAKGKGFELSQELAHLAPWKDKLNVYSKFNVPLDGLSNLCHFTGNVSVRTGAAPSKKGSDAPSIEVLVANAIGGASRFRSIEVACTGSPTDSITYSEGNVLNPSEVSPAALYTRIFGPEFRDPNGADFKPDPNSLVMQSVLSAVSDDRKELMKRVGAADRQRLDQYFTSIRQVEQQLEFQLQQPAPAVACAVPNAPKETRVGTDVDDVAVNHKLFAQLIAMAVACNQTKVFNIMYSASGSNQRQKGVGGTHHNLSHEEAIDEKLGYQKVTTSFLDYVWKSQVDCLEAFGSIKEGDGTLLDNMLLLMHSDTEVARTHTISGIPIMTIGGAGGRMKTGVHISGDNVAPVTRIGLTAMNAVGASIDAWGERSMRTSNPLTELLA